MVYYVYILYNTDYDKFYIGQTYSLRKRILEHKAGKSTYTNRYGDWTFVYYEKLPTRANAMHREKYFKSLKSKEYLKKFIKEKRSSNFNARLAQLVRASRLHREGQGFESLGVHNTGLSLILMSSPKGLFA